MYMGAVAAAQLSSNSNEFANIIQASQEKVPLEWLEGAMKVSCTMVFISLSGLCVIHPFLRLGEFIVNVVNAIAAWLVHFVLSLSEFKTCFHPTPPSFHIIGDVPSRFFPFEQQTYRPNSPQRGLWMDSQQLMASVCVRFK